jgi:uncharacterized membrane protein YgcG
MRGFDFSSWQAILTSIAAILFVTLIGVGIRLLMMLTFQQRRERQNRQINERLKALIAAYKTLGGSFTGNLSVNPTHLRDLRRANISTSAIPSPDAPPLDPPTADASDGAEGAESDRARRIRDAVEAALSDIILFGTDEQVKLAATAAQEMAAGRPVHVHDLVVSLRNYVRDALDLDPVPADLIIPNQGPARPSGTGGRGGERGGGESRGGRGGAGGGGGIGGGMAMGGLGIGVGVGASGADQDPADSSK